MHKQSDDDIRPLGGSGKAHCLARETRDPGPQRPRFARDLRRVSLAWVGAGGGEVPHRGARIIGGIAGDPQGLQPRLQLSTHRVPAPTTHGGQGGSCPVIDGLPPPSSRLLRAHARPPLINCRFVSPPDNHVHIVRRQRVEERLVHRGERRLFFLTR